MNAEDDNRIRAIVQEYLLNTDHHRSCLSPVTETTPARSERYFRRAQTKLLEEDSVHLVVIMLTRVDHPMIEYVVESGQYRREFRNLRSGAKYRRNLVHSDSIVHDPSTVPQSG